MHLAVVHVGRAVRKPVALGVVRGERADVGAELRGRGLDCVQEVSGTFFVGALGVA